VAKGLRINTVRRAGCLTDLGRTRRVDRRKRLLHLGAHGPLREDLPKIFAHVAEKKIDPLVNRTLPLLAAGSVEGKIVLTDTDSPRPQARSD
jgi:hypothetical protein